MTGARTDQLTEGQRAALRLVLKHHNSKEIAAIFGVSPSAIDKRIERAVQVLGVATRFEAARLLDEEENGAASPAAGRMMDSPAAPAVVPVVMPSQGLTYERAPSEPIDLSHASPGVAGRDRIEPWGLFRRFFGVVPRGGSEQVARNRLSLGDRVIRLFGVIGLVAVTTMALLNMTMTLSSLLRQNRTRAVPAQGTAPAAVSMGKDAMSQGKGRGEAGREPGMMAMTTQGATTQGAGVERAASPTRPGPVE